MQDLIGTLAGIMTTAALVPQVLQTWRTRRVNDVSLGMYVVFAIGVSLWLAYGVMTSSWPMIIANVVTLVLTLAIVVMKLKWG